MPALPDDPGVTREHAADRRVRCHAPEPARREPERTAHERGVVRRVGRVAPGRSRQSPTRTPTEPYV